MMLQNGVWLALLGAAAWGAPALPRPLAIALGVLAVAGVLLAPLRRAEPHLRAALAIGCGVVLAHVASAGPLPTDDEWLASPAALATLASLVAALYASLVGARASATTETHVRLDHEREHEASERTSMRGLASAAALVLLLLSLVPLGLLPLGFALELATILRPLAGAAVGLAAGLSMFALARPPPRERSPRRRLALTAGTFAIVALVALVQPHAGAPLEPPSRQAFPKR